MKNIIFVNAGAGSGKTYRLTTDLARILTQKDVKPSQVILTTFTELAASEFREKSRKEILNAKDEKGNPIDTDTRIKCATQLDNAFIGTAHSISYRFICKYWYLLEYGAEVQPMSEQNQDFYMSQSICNIATVDELKAFCEFRELFDITDNGRPYHLFWLPELKNVVEKMEYYDITSIEESIERSIATAKEVFKGETLPQIYDKTQKYLTLLRNFCIGLLNSGSAGKAGRFIETIDNVGDKIKYSIFKDKNFKECITETVGRGKSSKEFFNSLECIEAKEAYNQSFISASHLPVVENYIRAIFALASRWQEKLLAYKKENHIISFNDMEKIFLAMLTEPQYKEVQDDIRANFRLLMVDEFQDSNPIQLKIFNRISDLIAENGGRTIWVGDPKQSIFAFRGADSHFVGEVLKKFNFSDDGSAIPMCGVDMLGTDQLLESWRSRPALVKFANKVFLKPFTDSGLKEKQITLEPHFENADTLGEDQVLYTWKLIGNNKSTRANQLAIAIKELLDSKRQVHRDMCNEPTSNIEYRDIAVLCRNNSDCQDVATALRKNGLPTSCEETKLMQTIEVYLIKTLLLFIQNPSNKMLRAELAILLDDATTEAILIDRFKYVVDNRKEDDVWDKWMDTNSTITNIREFTNRYKNLSVYDTVVALCEELSISNFIEKWGDVSQRQRNISTVISMAKAYDDMCVQMGLGSSISGFVNYISTTKPNSKSDNSANTIKVLTYHKAKGLEWPVVILNQLEKDNKETTRKVCGVNVCENDENEDIFSRKHYINLLPSGIDGNGSTPTLMEDNIKKLPMYDVLQKQNNEESLRLLYVGVTRAKDVLISLTSENECKWINSIGVNDTDTNHPWGKEHGAICVEHSDTYDGYIETVKYHPLTSKPSLNDAPLFSLSPSTIKAFSNSFTNNKECGSANERIIDMNVFEGETSDAIKGTCIHNIFACYKPNSIAESMQMASQTLVNFGFNNISTEQVTKIIDSIKWLYDFLTKNYGSPIRIERECPLQYPLSTGQVLKGEIDLLWYFKAQDGNEKCVLIDYKTFPGKCSELEAHTQQYYTQLSAYYAALTGAGINIADALIYYPVQGQVRKLLK